MLQAMLYLTLPYRMCVWICGNLLKECAWKRVLEDHTFVTACRGCSQQDVGTSLHAFRCSQDRTSWRDDIPISRAVEQCRGVQTVVIIV